jgi:hypothetical protein
MKIVEVIQCSGDWFTARAGMPTASEFSNLITPGGKVKTGDSVDTYLFKKLAERWIGGPLPTTYSGGAIEQGTIKQDSAIPWYALTYRRKVHTVGFITTDDGRVGCSPDGWFSEAEGGIEVKCPDLHTHVRYLLDGVLPEAYMPQVQGSMFVTGAPRWVFLSYCPKLPPLVLTIERDEKVMEAMRTALAAFLSRLDEGYARLVEINGGAPVPATASEDDGNDFWG